MFSRAGSKKGGAREKKKALTLFSTLPGGFITPPPPSSWLQPKKGHPLPLPESFTLFSPLFCEVSRCHFFFHSPPSQTRSNIFRREIKKVLGSRFLAALKLTPR